VLFYNRLYFFYKHIPISSSLCDLRSGGDEIPCNIVGVFELFFSAIEFKANWVGSYN